MMQQDYSRALIVGAGKGLSAAIARVLSREGLQIALAARNIEKLAPLCKETGARAFACDVADAEQIANLFDLVDESMGPADVVVYNASARVRGPLTSLVATEVEKAIRVSAFGGFLVAQQAVKRMVKTGHGAVFFTGASASVKGYAESASFAMGKFALRGLAQSMARELAPHGIHVAHFVIDGGIKSPERSEALGASDSLLLPEAIAENYLHVLRQHRSAWTWEMELRPWVEKF
jgi:NAD(P)-dependent dehydrogenase (short-subunit alcohol dehydrogenase family)